ncbi:hypothetical protein FIBSPDRAFT_891565 [Athelia psychrophila]|uniref:Uncharacterized protein n=1 Tax=Athelia psychrophila TaxID=1759441 RepID=A0A166JKP3_9AGAM|nr:hypothetical protein FIBSPDRAFT_891565 [Fibularhizoctonia sp. CBS 109695]
MDAGIRACNAAHWCRGERDMSWRVRYVEVRYNTGVPRGCLPGGVGGRAVAGVYGAPTQCDSRECGRACKEILAGEEAVLRILGGRGPRTADRDGAVAAGASVHVLARHWKGVQHRCDELARTVRLRWGCELNELACGIPGGLCVFRVHELFRGWDTRMSLSVTTVETLAGARLLEKPASVCMCAMGEAGAGWVSEASARVGQLDIRGWKEEVGRRDKARKEGTYGSRRNSRSGGWHFGAFSQVQKFCNELEVELTN